MRTLQTVIDNLESNSKGTAVLSMSREGLVPRTAGDLSDSVRRLAGGLIRSGLSAGEPVILQAAPSADWLVGALAVMQAGAAAVPLDTQLKGEVLEKILSDCGAHRVFCDERRAGFYEERADRFGLDRIRLDSKKNDPDGWQSRCSSENDALPELKPDDRAAIFYTSGTTGPPKGVPLRHRNLAFQIDSLQDTGFISSSDRILLPLPLHHVYPFVIGMLLPMACGAPLVLPRSMTGPEILKALQQGRATILLGVPRLYQAMFTSIRSQFESRGRMAARGFDAVLSLLAWLRRRFRLHLGKTILKPLHDNVGPQLKILACGGSALDPALARKLDAMGWQISVGYGLTETSPLLTLNPPGSPKLDSVGRPIPRVKIRLDPAAHPGRSNQADAQPTEAAGVEGEILARGPGVFDGYHELPEKTAESFSEDGWFRTGDLGRFDEEGDLHLVGRVSELIVTPGGENIQPEQVEEAYGQSEIIREIGVLQENGDLVAAVVPDFETLQGQTAGEMNRAVSKAVEERARQLPSYQRIADFVVLHRALPRTRLGKIKRHLLLERFREAKAGGADESETGPISIEEMAAADRSILENPGARKTWDLLARRYPDRHLKPDTRPRLELGIDSMGWLDLTLAIRAQTGVELDEEAVADIRTVRDLLQAVAAASERGEPPGADPFDDPEGFLDNDQKRWLEPTGPMATRVTRILFSVNRGLMKQLFQLTVKGRENLPNTGPYVIAPNHVSYLDSFALAAALEFDIFQRTCWGGWTGAAFRNVFTRFISRLARVVPVDPERGFLSSMAFGAAILKRENNLIWYPEGRRSPDGRLQPFKPGIGVLLDELPVPVVPVFIRGTAGVLPPGKFLQGFFPVTVTFGQSLEPKSLREKGRGETPQERIIDALYDRMDRLQTH